MKQAIFKNDFQHFRKTKISLYLGDRTVLEVVGTSKRYKRSSLTGLYLNHYLRNFGARS